MIIIRKKIAAAAGLTYEYEFDWNGATDQDFNDTDVLNTTGEGQISGSGTFECQIVDGDIDILTNELVYTDQTTFAADDLGIMGQQSVSLVMGSCYKIKFAHWEGVQYIGFDASVDTRPYVDDPAVYMTGSWLVGAARSSSNTRYQWNDTDGEIVIAVGGFDSNGYPYINGDTAANFTYGMRYFVKDSTFRSGNWRLCGFHPIVSMATTRYPAHFGGSAQTALKSLSIPESSSYVLDGATAEPEHVSKFNGSVGDLISSEYTPDVGNGWGSDNFDLVSGGGCHCNSAGESIFTYTANVKAYGEITTPNSGTTAFGIVFRYSNSSNYWYLKFTPGSPYSVETIEYNSGSPTVRASNTRTLNANTAYRWYVTAENGTSNHTNSCGIDDYTWHYTANNSFNESSTGFGIKDEGTSNATFNMVCCYDVEDTAYATEFDAIT